MNNYKYLILIILVVTIFSGLVFYQKNSQKNELFFGGEIEIKNEDGVDMALYRKVISDGVEEKNLYMGLDIGDTKNFDDKSLIKLHTNGFWDPKKCSQMQLVLGKEKFVFVDSFIETEGDPGFSAFVFVYDVKTNKLMQYESPISINKIYKTENQEIDEFYTISKDKKTDKYSLYKLDLLNKKFVFIKEYSQEGGYGLVTATTTLAWCKDFGAKCVYDQDHIFERKDKEYRTEKSLNNVFEVREFYKNKEVFRLKEADMVRSFILGAI